MMAIRWTFNNSNAFSLLINSNLQLCLALPSLFSLSSLLLPFWPTLRQAAMVSIAWGATMAITTMADIEDASVSDNEANVSYYERAEDLFIIW